MKTHHVNAERFEKLACLVEELPILAYGEHSTMYYRGLERGLFIVYDNGERIVKAPVPVKGDEQPAKAYIKQA